RSQMPLTPLDRAETRFRHHPLLAEMLQAELRRSEPHHAAEIHRRASVWHERHGAPEPAVDHALAAGDADRAAALPWRLAPADALGGPERGATLARGLAHCDEPQLAARPPLALAAAVDRLAHGDRDAADRLLNAVECEDREYEHRIGAQI